MALHSFPHRFRAWSIYLDTDRGRMAWGVRSAWVGASDAMNIRFFNTQDAAIRAVHQLGLLDERLRIVCWETVGAAL